MTGTHQNVVSVDKKQIKSRNKSSNFLYMLQDLPHKIDTQKELTERNLCPVSLPVLC
jgi:hypothetical protein